MRKISIILGTLALTSTIVLAGPNSNGAYIGVGLGNSGYADDDMTKKELRIDNIDTADSGYKVYGGYQFNNVIGIELGYTDYGKFSADDGYSQAATAFSVAANVGYSFLDGQLRPFATLGLGYVALEWENFPAHVTTLNSGAGAPEFNVVT